MQNNYVEMKAVTWQKDSHGLFDYETQLLTVEKYRIDDQKKIFRQGQEISTQPLESDSEISQYLTSITEQSSNFYIQPGGEEENYLIVRSLKNSQGTQKGYKLEPGDVIKLGRMEYVIIETKDQSQVYQVTSDVLKEDWFEVVTETVPDDMQATCKICLSDIQTAEDPFIAPCNCKGTCQFVHFGCLLKWIESRCTSKQQNGTFSYRWKQQKEFLNRLQCELCESLLPQKITIGNRGYSFDVIQRPNCPYLIMQSTSKDKKDKKSGKAVYVMQFQGEEPIKMGRGHQCDIRISDISVSRLHAYIKYEEGNFIIVDNNSKFGTLVKLSKPFKIEQEKVAIQIGRTVLTFVIKQSQ